MKTIYAIVLFGLLFFLSSNLIFASNLIDSAITFCSITKTLRVGSFGEEVKCLQGGVGTIVDGKFGPKTLAAVFVFQQKYGLAPDGVVGPLTRGVFNEISAKVYPSGCDSTTTYSRTTGKKCSNVYLIDSSASTENKTTVDGMNISLSEEKPDILKDPEHNLEMYISAVKAKLQKNGVSSANISYIEEKIRRTTAENPDALEKFFDTQRAIYNKISGKSSESLFAFLFKKTLNIVDDFFSIPRSFASSLQQFGGYITYSNEEICDCPSGYTQVFVALPGGRPPISNISLDYLNDSQAYDYHTMPTSEIAVVGFYMADVTSCYTYVIEDCVEVSSDGLITPIVGSSK